MGDLANSPSVAFDLFAGAGGASCGLREAGYDVVAFEKWDVAADTHDANHARATVRCDLMTYDWSDHLTPDLLWASPPCQPFSSAGKRAGKLDARDGMPAYLAAVKALLPPVTIMENVRGLTFEAHEEYLHGYVLGSLRELGYAVTFAVLDAADYGVPQNRDRLFVIARRDGGPMVLPAPTHTDGGGLFTLPWVTMAEALGWGYDVRPSPTVTGGGGATGGAEPFGHAARDALNAYVRTNSGNGYAHDYERAVDEPSPTVTSRVNRWHVDTRTLAGTFDAGAGPTPTITTETGGQWVLPENQRLTVQQAARLQDFPNDYVWCGTKTACFMQIGNAVPRTLARVLAEANQ